MSLQLHFAHPEYGHCIFIGNQWVNPDGPSAWANGDPKRIAEAEEAAGRANRALGAVLISHGVEDPGEGERVEIPPTLPGVSPEMRVWVSQSVPSRAIAEFFPKKPPEWIKRVGGAKDCSACVLGVDGRVATAVKSRTGQGTISLVFNDWKMTWAAPALSRLVLHETGVRAILKADERPIGDGWLECSPIIQSGEIVSRRWAYSGPQFGVWTPLASNWEKEEREENEQTA